MTEAGSDLRSVCPGSVSCSATLPLYAMATAYQHTYTDTGGRVLGVMIHGAIRNITVSVKMGVRGISWVRERREGIKKSYQSAFH